MGPRFLCQALGREGKYSGPPEENQSIITLYISASVLMRFYEDLPSYGGELER